MKYLIFTIIGVLIVVCISTAQAADYRYIPPKILFAAGSDRSHDAIGKDPIGLFEITQPIFRSHYDGVDFGVKFTHLSSMVMIPERERPVNHISVYMSWDFSVR